MKREAGILNILIVPVVILTVMVLGVGYFAYDSYTKYVEYRDDADVKIKAAVSEAVAEKEKEMEAEFAEIEKQPTRKFSGPEQLGTVGISYPKTWSVYVDKNSNNTYEAYFHPGMISPISTRAPEALRISIQERPYADMLRGFEPRIKKAELTSKPYKLQSGEGTRIDGQFEKNIEGAMVLFPLRDKTVQIYTESKDFLNDFDKIVLPSLTFIP